MPPRLPNQPDRGIKRYRERLNQEMKEKGETDRSLADKLTEAGFPVPHTSIYKTRAANRQPTLDECMAVAGVFGYATLDDFLAGPATMRVIDAVAHLNQAMSLGMIQVRHEVQAALTELRWALNDPEVIAALDKQDPDWRHSYRQVETDLRWLKDDQDRLWEQTLVHVRELLPEPHEEVGDAPTQ